MKEAILILGVLLVIVVLTAIRYRKQIAAVMQIWRSLRSVKEQFKQKQEQVGEQKSVSGGPLVNCARCGTWVPEQRAIKLRGGVIYCSTECLETTGKVR